MKGSFVMWILVFSIALHPFKSNAQGVVDSRDSLEKKEQVFINPEQKAVPKGGFDTFLATLGSNIKPPVDLAVSQMKMVVKVIIEKNGRVSEIVFIQGGDYRIESEVERLLKASRWAPAVHEGVKVRNQVTFPLNLHFRR